MDKSHFIDKCKELCLTLGIDMPNKLTLDQYYDKFILLHKDRFNEAIEHLKSNTKKNKGGYVRFPLVWDFKEAVRLTQKSFDNIPVYSDLTPEEQKDAVKVAKYWADKYRPEEKPNETVINPPSQADLNYRMKKEGKVYSVKLRKWVDKSLKNNIGGDFIEPRLIDNEIPSIGEIIDE